MCPGGFRPWRVPYPMRAAAMPMADPHLVFHWLPDPGFLIQDFLIQGPRRRAPSTTSGAPHWGFLGGPNKVWGSRHRLQALSDRLESLGQPGTLDPRAHPARPYLSMSMSAAFSASVRRELLPKGFDLPIPSSVPSPLLLPILRPRPLPLSRASGWVRPPAPSGKRNMEH